MPNKETKLIPVQNFKVALGKVLRTSKRESDEQLARFQASNKAKREAQKPKD